MAESTVIKEFLVALGYKVDESAMKKFTGGIAAATKSVFILGTVVEATAIAVATGVARFASNLEALYFAAQRTNSSASSLKAFDLAARNFGASIEEAQGSVEGLASFLRNNPGGASIIEGWLASVGLSGRNAATGAQLTGTALIAQIGKMFQIMREHGRTFQANMIAGQLGISDRTMLAISSSGFEDELARQNKRAAGWDKVSASAHRFVIMLEDLKLQFYQMMLGFEGPAMRTLEGLMPKLSRLIHDHGKQIVTDLAGLFTFFIEGIGRLVDWLDKHGREMLVRLEALFLDFNFNFSLYVEPVFSWLYTKILQLDEATGGWSTKLLVTLGLLKAMGATGLVTGILGLGGALAKALGGAAALSTGEGAWAAAGLAFGATAALAIGVGLGALFDKYFPNNWLAQAGHWAGGQAGDLHDWLSSKIGDYAAGRREMFAVDRYQAKPDHQARDDRFSPVFDIDLDITVNGASDGQVVGKHVASEAEMAIRRAGSDLVREFNAVVR